MYLPHSVIQVAVMWLSAKYLLNIGGLQSPWRGCSVVGVRELRGNRYVVDPFPLEPATDFYQGAMFDMIVD
jgi:hypothetical protein